MNQSPLLELCKRSNPKYQEIRDRHYVENKGTHGQQIHFLIHYNDRIVGIISGASSVYAVESRDSFFKIPKDRSTKQDYYLPAIINNVVFRLEYHEKNLGTKVLSKWRKISSLLWKEFYNIPIIGFETFIVEEDYRKGSMYKADNWQFVGKTKGSTKSHNGLQNKSERLETSEKLVFCRWEKNEIIPKEKYVSSWRKETNEEKTLAKLISEKRNNMIGRIF